MADEARLHEILDIAEQAKAEGDQATFAQAMAMYQQESGPPPPPPPQTNGQKIGDMALAPLDALATMVSGAFAYPASGIAGLVSAPFVGMDKAADIVTSTQEALTHQPKTRGAQAVLGAVSKPFEALHSGAQKLGDKSLESGFTLPGLDPVETATAISTTVEGVPQALLALTGEAGSLKGIKRAAPTAEGRLLQSEGMNLKRSQMGSEAAKSLDRSSDAVLGESSFDVAQAGDYNRALMDRAGGNVNSEGRITPAELKDLRSDISREYNDLHARRSTPLDIQLEAELNKAVSDAVADGLDASDPGARRVVAQIQQFRKLAAQNGGSVPGKAGQRIRTKLGDLTQSDDGFVANYAKAVQDAMDTAWERAAPAADRAKMERTRQRFRISLALNKAMKGNATGYVSPNRLYSVIDDGHPLADLAYAGKNVLPDSVANSGTPARGADIGKLVGMVNPNKWGDLARVVGGAAGGRFLNESPNLGAKSAAVARGVAPAGAASSGEAMLDQQNRMTEEYLRSIGF